MAKYEFIFPWRRMARDEPSSARDAGLLLFRLDYDYVDALGYVD
ncbi:hypothetical protein Pyrfu_1206 [Pyrolobus fumarii 1A]|uniref:Uncharacterized protein n=1 Tax=Pyrolobus fumarii (strain DSM 11204 / 1A) TaxID=694429 RepID=G0EFW7_PYRF1|nr:hypothetical protein Pyrfu_1206 [Pyrolobus fumarii 1A]